MACDGMSYGHPEIAISKEKAMAMSNPTILLCRSIARAQLRRMSQSFEHPDSILGFMPHDLPDPVGRYKTRKANLDLLEKEVEKRKEEGRWH